MLISKGLELSLLLVLHLRYLEHLFLDKHSQLFILTFSRCGKLLCVFEFLLPGVNLIDLALQAVQLGNYLDIFLIKVAIDLGQLRVPSKVDVLAERLLFGTLKFAFELIRAKFQLRQFAFECLNLA